MRRRLLIVCVAVLGCSGGTTPGASSPFAGEAPDDPGASSEVDQDPPSSDKPSASPEDESGKDATASADDVRAVLQLVIDDESLGPFLHLDQPGRFPLQIAGSNLPDGLTKSNEPVKIVQPPASKKDAVLVFTAIDVRGKHAVVRYRYDIEGVQGSSVLDKREHGWELTRSKVVER